MLQYMGWEIDQSKDLAKVQKTCMHILQQKWENV